MHRFCDDPGQNENSSLMLSKGRRKVEKKRVNSLKIKFNSIRNLPKGKMKWKDLDKHLKDEEK